MKTLLLLGSLILLLTSCTGSETEPDPWPYALVELVQNEGTGEEFSVPARFDPATGETAAICGETEHGDGCPFRYGGYFDAAYTVWQDTLFWVEEVDNSSILYAWNMTTGENKPVTELKSVYNYRILGDYLFTGGSRTVTGRIYLPDWTESENPYEKMPHRVEGDTAYYMIEGMRSGEGGIYRQNLYETGSRPPIMELLFADAQVRSVWYDTDAVFWKGNSSFYEEETHLYRYDLRERTNIILKADFDGAVCCSSGEWLYYAEKHTLWQLHKTTGEIRPVYESDTLTLYTGNGRIQEVGGYIVVQAADGEKTGRLVYNPTGYETVFYPLPE
ncbi:MAG: hypothetical protein IJ480_01080 [Clostridia bacterium]|nr:hypothetical protein [Clostridia bacterium]